jgi:formylglycine-generating enzyme required for sulfatase activity
MKTCLPLLLLLHSVVAFSQTAQPLVNILPDSTDNMVFIPGGTFQMGSQNGKSDEKPVHTVTLSSFYMSKYELTVAEFEQFVSATGYQTDADKKGWSLIWNGQKHVKCDSVNWRCDVKGSRYPASEYNHPVIHVSWNDAVAYCQWKSKQTGKNYRLPTEAEWEYAAGGGNPESHSRTLWAGTSDEGQLRQFANYDGQEDLDKYFYTAPVGSLKPNALGLHDMSGNVLEWCSDLFGSYTSDSQTNPTGATIGSSRVLRGGLWSYGSQFCRVTVRGFYGSSSCNSLIGFRLVRE